MNSIGERIRLLRKNRRITQEELGRLLGIQLAAVSKYETGRVIPDEKTLKLICATYNVNYQWLTEGREPMFLDMDADSLVDRYAPDESEYFRATVRAAMGLSDEAWIKWRDFVDDMRDKLRNGTAEP